MAERNVRSRVVKALKSLHGFAVENVCLPGTPDVNYAGGWIELKWLKSWPEKEGTPIRIPHYTNQQRVFAMKRDKAGERCWWLLNVEKTNDWLLLDGTVAAKLIGTATKSDLIAAAAVHWNSGAAMERGLAKHLTS